MMNDIYKIFVMNMGATSTKVAYFENLECKTSLSIKHAAGALSAFKSVPEQYEFRKKIVLNYMEDNNLSLEEMDCIVSRGGNTEPISSGTYRINEKMVSQVMSGVYGMHPTNLGVKIAYELAGDHAVPMVVDTPVTDEFEPLARYSGLPEIPRVSSFHVLNQKGAAKKYAAKIGKNYKNLNLVVVHLGGGISIAAHAHGRLIDANNALDGDGPFSTNRTGGLPVGGLIELCYSGEYTKEEMLKKINGTGGLMAYVGLNDVMEVENQAKDDDKCAEVLDAMIYQTCKEIGAYATVLKGDVNAILLTGGMANSEYICKKIKERVSFIAPVEVFPGEYEMESLARGSYEGLTGKCEIKEMK